MDYSMDIWDLCVPDAEQLECIAVLQKYHETVEYNSDTSINNTTTHSHSISPSSNLITSLQLTEKKCRAFIENLDGILSNLEEISFAHGEVTARSNDLLSNCENLLEQQHSLQDLVHAIDDILVPFNNVEDFAHILGIPVDAYGNKSVRNKHHLASSLHHATPSSDPRSSEFLKTMNHITTAMKFVKQTPDMKDAHLYRKWLKQLQHRAHSITTRNMLELLSSTDASCRALMHQQVTVLSPQTPLESLPQYQKFRALGFRMRQLTNLLPSHYDDITIDETGEFDVSSQSTSHLDPVVEVRQSYVVLRTNLLATFLSDVNKAAIQNAIDPTDGTKAVSTVVALAPHVRRVFSYLVRVAQLEQQLFVSLFKQIEGAAANDIEDTRDAEQTVDPSVQLSLEYCGEVESIVDALCTHGISFLRPIIIKEVQLEELCKVVSILAEDIRGQISAMRLPKALVRRLHRCLDDTLHDAQERLVYCAEIELRQGIQLFEPLPSQLAYPELLEKHVTTEDVTATWYPPLTTALSLLSKLYGVVEKGVFEDFARRTVDEVLQALRKGTDGVKKRSSVLHGDLFLVRHILILREQLTPFETNLQSTRKYLDFTSTTKFFSSLNTRSLLRFDASNGFVQLAIHGLPTVHDAFMDTKKEIDSLLKLSCLSMKQSAIKMIMGPIESYLAKVTAFIGDIPTQAKDGEAPSLSADMLTSLRSQSFMKPERVKEMLTSALDTVMLSAPDMKVVMELYIDNLVARSILLKPVAHEIESAKKKLTFVIRHYMENSSIAKEYEQILASISATATSELGV